MLNEFLALLASFSAKSMLLFSPSLMLSMSTRVFISKALMLEGMEIVTNRTEIK